VSLSLGKNIVVHGSTPKKNLPKPARKQCSGEKGSGVRGFTLDTIFEEPQFEGSQHANHGVEFSGFQQDTQFERLGDSFAFRSVLKNTNLQEIALIVEQAKAKAKER
jgi:hypothetical protein